MDKDISDDNQRGFITLNVVCGIIKAVYLLKEVDEEYHKQCNAHIAELCEDRVVGIGCKVLGISLIESPDDIEVILLVDRGVPGHRGRVGVGAKAATKWYIVRKNIPHSDIEHRAGVVLKVLNKVEDKLILDKPNNGSYSAQTEQQILQIEFQRTIDKEENDKHADKYRPELRCWREDTSTHNKQRGDPCACTIIVTTEVEERTDKYRYGRESLACKHYTRCGNDTVAGVIDVYRHNHKEAQPADTLQYRIVVRTQAWLDAHQSEEDQVGLGLHNKVADNGLWYVRLDDKRVYQVEERDGKPYYQWLIERNFAHKDCKAGIERNGNTEGLVYICDRTQLVEQHSEQHIDKGHYTEKGSSHSYDVCIVRL